MKDGTTCWMVERMTVTGWLTYLSHDCIGPCWVTDPNEGIHFADQESAEKMCEDIPIEWDVKVAEHGWGDHNGYVSLNALQSSQIHNAVEQIPPVNRKTVDIGTVPVGQRITLTSEPGNPAPYSISGKVLSHKDIVSTMVTDAGDMVISVHPREQCYVEAT